MSQPEKYLDNLRLEVDKLITRKDYQNKYEYKFEKHTNLIPKKNNKLTCVILTEDRGVYFIVRKKEKQDSFRFNKGLYIIDNESIHIAKNGNRYSIYLEGISTPLKMSNIEKYEEEIEYYDLDGTVKTALVQKIRGLKYDSKILDIFTDRKLAENFTKMKDDFKYGIVLLILGVVSLVMIGIAYGLIYYFR